jgi:hypothetical protein
VRKLTLQIDELRVESFEVVSHGAAARGTVRGHDYTPWVGCIDSIMACQVGASEWGCGEPPGTEPTVLTCQYNAECATTGANEEL